MLLSFLLVIIFTLSNQQCPIFKCSSSSLSNNQCISYNPSENTYLISLCPSNQLCDYFTDPSKTEIFCSDREKKLLVDTEQCTSNSDCYSNNCQSGKCKDKWTPRQKVSVMREILSDKTINERVKDKWAESEHKKNLAKYYNNRGE